MPVSSAGHTDTTVRGFLTLQRSKPGRSGIVEHPGNRGITDVVQFVEVLGTDADVVEPVITLRSSPPTVG
jgi:hypothetical protein